MKIKKLVSLLFIPCLAWVVFAASQVYAQEFNFTKAKADYIFQSDNYKNALFDFNSKKDSYNKNQTLSLKEELRISLLNFVGIRNEFIKSYLNLLRTKTVEAAGLGEAQKQSIYTQLDKEVVWYDSRENSYSKDNTLEDILNKSKEEDSRYETETDPAIKYTLAYLSYSDITLLKNKHLEIYKKLKTESETLVGLKRADQNLFKRWFDDIDRELSNLEAVEKEAVDATAKIYAEESWERRKSYENVVEILQKSISNLSRLNNFIKELETVIKNIR